MFLALSGSAFFEDGEGAVREFVDVALGGFGLFGLDENGIVHQIVSRRPERLAVTGFVSAIATAADYLMCLATNGQIVVRHSTTRVIDPDFECELPEGLGAGVAVAGQGNFMVLSATAFKVCHYSDRIGRVLDVGKDSRGCFTCRGAIGKPVKIHRQPIASKAVPSLADMKTLVAAYERDVLLAVLERGLWRTMVSVLVRDERAMQGDEGTDSVPRRDRARCAVDLMPALIVRNKFNKLPATILSKGRAIDCFTRYSEDLKQLGRAGLFALLPRIEATPVRRVDKLSTSLLQTSHDSTVVPSLPFNEGRLLVFSCGRIMVREELLASVTDVRGICTANSVPSTGKTIFNAYLRHSIPAPRPRCLGFRLQRYPVPSVGSHILLDEPFTIKHEPFTIRLRWPTLPTAPRRPN